VRIKYNKTNWVDNETPVNAENMNKIETALENLYNLAVSPSDFSTNSQIKPTITDGNISLDFNGLVLREVTTRPARRDSEGTPGDFYIEKERMFGMYICVSPNFWLFLHDDFNFPEDSEEDEEEPELEPVDK
jgi:hypothetical protein